MTVRRNGLARLVATALLLVGFALIAGCSSSDPQNTLAPKGDVGDDLRDLMVPIGLIAIAILIAVEGAILYIAFRYRRREGSLPKQTHGNNRLEIAWTIAPTVLMLGIAVPTLVTLFDLDDPPQDQDAVAVRVTANQWWWEFDYPELGVVTANELHIPVDKPVSLVLESNDVIHSFWVPKLAGKRDVVPGRANTMWLNANEPGVYLGQCAEFCGLSHAVMRVRVIAQPQDEFDAWVAAQKSPASAPTGPLAQQGATKFANTCSVCHTVSGTGAAGKVGPNLTHFASRDTFVAATLDRTDENIARWLRNPPGVKPGSKMPNLGLSDEEIKALTAYLQGLE